jgi:hypothetical protein
MQLCIIFSLFFAGPTPGSNFLPRKFLTVMTNECIVDKPSQATKIIASYEVSELSKNLSLQPRVSSASVPKPSTSSVNFEAQKPTPRKKAKLHHENHLVQLSSLHSVHPFQKLLAQKESTKTNVMSLGTQTNIETTRPSVLYNSTQTDKESTGPSVVSFGTQTDKEPKWSSVVAHGTQTDEADAFESGNRNQLAEYKVYFGMTKGHHQHLQELSLKVAKLEAQLPKKALNKEQTGIILVIIYHLLAIVSKCRSLVA